MAAWLAEEGEGAKVDEGAKVGLAVRDPTGATEREVRTIPQRLLKESLRYLVADTRNE